MPDQDFQFPMIEFIYPPHPDWVDLDLRIQARHAAVRLAADRRRSIRQAIITGTILLVILLSTIYMTGGFD